MFVSLSFQFKKGCRIHARIKRKLWLLKRDTVLYINTFWRSRQDVYHARTAYFSSILISVSIRGYMLLFLNFVFHLNYFVPLNIVIYMHISKHRLTPKGWKHPVLGCFKEEQGHILNCFPSKSIFFFSHQASSASWGGSQSLAESDAV